MSGALTAVAAWQSTNMRGQYAYQCGTVRELAQQILLAVNEAQDRGFEGEHVLFENCLLRAQIDIADNGDAQLCSRALQLLRKSGHCRYSRRQRAWQFYNWPNKTIR